LKSPSFAFPSPTAAFQSAHLKEHAQKLGYFLQHFNVDEFQDGRHATQVLFSRGVQGIIVSSSFESKMLPDMDWPRFFVVGLGGRIIETPNFRGEPFYRTAVDHFGLTVHAWNKTWEKGYRRIGFALFGLNRGWVDDELRWAAAQICLQRLPAGDRIPPLLIETNKKERSDHNQEMRKWIERHRPEVVIGFNSFVGHIVRWAGFRIPQDVAFVNLHKATSFEHEIAGQDNDTGMREMRRECLLSTVELLDQQIRHHQYGSGTQPRTVMIHSEWIEGDTLPLKSSDKPAQARSL
jgi:DNA-binding LacI/PurR family transcriptional regulator